MHKLSLPRMGQTMEEGLFRQWLKKEGEPYEIGDELYEIETEKAALVIEAKLPGTIVRAVAEPDEVYPVGALFAIVQDSDETLTEAEIEEAIASAEASEEDEAAEETPTPAEHATEAAPPRESKKVRAVPKARALAEEHGIDLSQLHPADPSGLISVEDVRRSIAATTEDQMVGASVRERKKLSGVGQAMARTMELSWKAPQFVQIFEFDASTMIERKRGSDFSYADLMIDSVVSACQQVPEVVATLSGDEIVYFDDVNVCIAAATERGLVLPVIKSAQAVSIEERSAAQAQLLARARAGDLAPDDMTGGTITVSNLGPGDVETGTPLLTPPQSTIVFFGSLKDRVVAIEGRPEVRPTIFVSVAYDHRIVDGGTGSRFVSALKRSLEAAA